METKTSFEQLKEYVQCHTIKELIENSITQFELLYALKPEGELTSRIHRLNEVSSKTSTVPEGTRIKQEIFDIVTNLSEYERLYNDFFQEEQSRLTFLSILWYRITRQTQCISDALEKFERQYFEPWVIEALNTVTFVDCGGLDGLTSIEFVTNCPDYKQIYIYEPIPEAYDICVDTIEKLGLENVILRNYAVSDCSGQVKFDKSISGSSRIDENGEIVVNTVSVDDDIKEKIGFLKMDIEGNEKQALLGAINHIRSDRPVLAICAYHLADDLREIPRMLESFCPDYIFYMRHYTTSINETVLYAIPTMAKSNEKAQSNAEIIDSRRDSLLRCFELLYAQNKREKEALFTQSTFLMIQLEKHRIALYETTKANVELRDWAHQLENAKESLQCQLKFMHKKR